MRRSCAIVLLAVALAVLSAPGAHAASVSTERARAEIARLVGATYPGLAFGNVACPGAVTRAVRTTFTCTVQLPGAFLVVDATQTDGRGSVTLSSPQAVLTKQGLEQLVAANASLAATVDCGPAAWVVRRPGQQLSCTAALADGTTRTVQLTVRDAAGNVAITSVS
jgi:hypothetical protein